MRLFNPARTLESGPRCLALEFFHKVGQAKLEAELTSPLPLYFGHVEYGQSGRDSASCPFATFVIFLPSGDSPLVTYMSSATR